MLDRRDFLKLASLSGMAVYLGVPRRARAAELHGGPYYLFFQADGGWDPTLLCDPKGANGINRSYAAGDIRTAGNLRYAPTTANQTFFQKYYSRLLVLNGLDMGTNNHEAGRRYAWTGRRESKIYPAIGALLAGAKNPSVPLAFLSYGGVSATGELVPLARVDPSDLLRISNPDSQNGDATRPFHGAAARARIDAALQARHERKAAGEALPWPRGSRSALYLAGLSASSLSAIQPHLPTALTGDALQDQVLLALAACKAGICVSANLRLGGFDSHDDNDNKQVAGLARLLGAIDLAMERAGVLGIQEQLTIVAGSDFARTPRYNDGNGKDHWSVGSMLLMGQGIAGNRVVGATGEDQKALSIDPVTLETSGADGAVKLRPEHVHLALRRLAGVETSAGATRYPLTVEPLDLLLA